MRRRFLRHYLGTAILLFMAFGGLTLWGMLTGAPKAAPDFPPELQPALDLAVKHYGLPGMAVAIVHADRIETAVSGVRAVGGHDRVQPGDLWHLGSNTKAFTATLLGMLVAEGKLNWDTTPAQVWPDWDLEPQFREITLRELLFHRAGIPEYTEADEVERLPEIKGDPRTQRRAFVQYVLGHKPARRRGQYLYSNAGYSVAAAMAEQATGQSYEEMLQARILQPLGLKGYLGWPVTFNTAEPSSHYGTSGKYEPHDLSDEYEVPDFLDPAGDLSLSIGDYARWLQVHLRGLEGKPPLAAGTAKGGQFSLTSAMIADLHRPAAHPHDDECYSCGWIEQVPMSGANCCTHDGSLGTFYATAYIQPGRDIAVAVLTNAGDDNASAAVHAVVEAILDDAAP